MSYSISNSMLNSISLTTSEQFSRKKGKQEIALQSKTLQAKFSRRSRTTLERKAHICCCFFVCFALTCCNTVLNRTVVDNMDSYSLGSILEDNLCHKTTYSRKIELNKHMHSNKVKTTTTLEALSYFICFT